MIGDHPRRAAGPAPSQDRYRNLTAAAVVGACAILTILLVGVADDSFKTGQRPVVTVQELVRSGDPAVSAQAGAMADGYTPGRRLGEGLVLAPRIIENRIAGYVVEPDTDPAILTGAALRSGDLLIDLDGLPLDANRIEALGDELSLADSFEVTFQRDGQIRRRLVRFDR